MSYSNISILGPLLVYVCRCPELVNVLSNVFLGLVRMLTGKAAKREFVQKITFLCWNHHPQIKAIDTVRAYHLAHGYLVEVDIILDEGMPLK